MSAWRCYSCGVHRRSSLLAVLAAALAAGSLAGGVGAGTSGRAHYCVAGTGSLTFRAADRVRLVGHRWGGLRPGRRTAVVLAHQSRGDLCEWQPYARRLARLGFFVLAFDFRSHGESAIREGDVSGRLPGDVAAAVKTVRKLGAKRVYVVGASMGGIAALAAAPNIRPALTGVVSVSAPAQMGHLDATRWAPKLRVRTLYLAAEGDQASGYDFAADARRLHELTAAPKQLGMYPGAAHGIALVTGAGAPRTLLERFLRGR